MSDFLIVSYGSCESSEWTDGALLIQPDALGDDGGNAGAQSMQPLGLYARPADPSAAGAAGALVGRKGDETFIAPTTDPRCINTVPQGPKGSVTLYAPQPDLTSYVHLDGGADGKAFTQILLKYGNNKSLSLTFDTKASEPAITIRHGEGHGIVLTNDKKVLLESANGQNRVEVSDSGTLIVGPFQVQGGVAAGGSSGLPVLTTSDMDALKTGLAAHIAGLTSTAPGSLVSSTVPLVAPTPGSSKLSAAT